MWQDDGETRAPALHTLDDVLRFRGDEEYRAVLVHSSIEKNPDAKATVENEWEEQEKIPAWQLTKVRNQKEVIEEARNKGRNVHFCVIDGSLSSEDFGVGTSVSKVQRQGRAPR